MPTGDDIKKIRKKEAYSDCITLGWKIFSVSVDTAAWPLNQIACTGSQLSAIICTVKGVSKTAFW